MNRRGMMRMLALVGVSGSAVLACSATDGNDSWSQTTQPLVSCDGVPEYYEGTTDQDVQNEGSKYHCNVPGWCSQAAWAYEPGVGLYWETAWSLVDECDTTGTGGSSSGGTSGSGGTAGSGGEPPTGGTGGEPPTGGTGGTTPSDLELEGTSNMNLKTDPVGFHHMTFDGGFDLTNNTGLSGVTNKQLFFFAAEGGYAFQNPSTNEWWANISSSSSPAHAGPFGWGWSAPLTHLVLRVDATLGGSPANAVTEVPILRSGYSAPAPVDYGDEINIGVQGPLELVELASGQRWVGIVGTVVDMTNTATQRPTVVGNVRDANGSTIASLSTSQSVSDAAPVRKFLAWAEIPSGLTPVDVYLHATQNTPSGVKSQVRIFPLEDASPVEIESPLHGTWSWNNGPGQTFWHAHSGSPEARYAYDQAIYQYISGSWRDHTGDPSVNTSYFAWGEPIYAVADGTVVQVYDDSNDNNGNTFDHANEPNNEITIQHTDGTYSRYAHMIKGSALVTLGQQVTAGQQIAQVGNAGSSSGPHLHFHMYTIDASGRVKAVPFSVNGMKTESGTPVTGVPKGTIRYQTGTICVPQCDDKQCGDDTCGGSCGSCGANETCDGAQQCVCVPQCSGKECGTDGCGGTCGTCSGGETCNASGQCETSGGGCSGLPNWSQGTLYNGGDQVQHNGQKFECRPWPYNGWCDDGGAYEPGIGFAYTDAWTLVGDCN